MLVLETFLRGSSYSNKGYDQYGEQWALSNQGYHTGIVTSLDKDNLRNIKPSAWSFGNINQFPHCTDSNTSSSIICIIFDSELFFSFFTGTSFKYLRSYIFCIFKADFIKSRLLERFHLNLFRFFFKSSVFVRSQSKGKYWIGNFSLKKNVKYFMMIYSFADVVISSYSALWKHCCLYWPVVSSPWLLQRHSL